MAPLAEPTQNRAMRLLLIGPPGSGKGTQGERLAEALDVQHIAAGDVLRAHVYGETKLGLQVAGLLKHGELVPDKLITEALTPTLSAAAEAGRLHPRRLPAHGGPGRAARPARAAARHRAASA